MGDSPQDGLKTTPRRPRTPPRRPKTAQDAPKTAQNAPKTGQDASKTLPRTHLDAQGLPQDDPRRFQDGPRRLPEAKKTSPNASKKDPQTPNAPRNLTLRLEGRGGAPRSAGSIMLMDTCINIWIVQTAPSTVISSKRWMILARRMG